MSESDVLLTIAEVAIAFAGFASLVSVLGRGSSVDDPRVSGIRMRGMIVFSLLTVAFSLFPLLLHRYGLAESTVWRLSSTVLSIGFLGTAFWVVAVVRRLNRLELAGRRISPLAGTPPFIGSILGTVLLASNAVVISPAVRPAVYLTGLGLLLFLAGFAFTVIVFSFLPRIDGGEPPAPELGGAE